MPEYPLPVIAGIDPGTTSALAILDTDGNLLSVCSRKNLTRADISKRIVEFGRPVIISADRNPAPAAVEKLVSVFSARLVVPEENLSKREKNRLAREFLKRDNDVKLNQHEKDALASAVHAYNSIRPTMLRVEQRLKALGYSGRRDLQNYARTRAILHRDHVKRSIERFMKESNTHIITG